MKEKDSLNISKKSFITATIIIFTLMLFTYILSNLIPSGEYTRVLDGDGHYIIDITQAFHFVDGGISFSNWLFSPILLLFSDDSFTIIAIILFLLIIGGIFNSLNACGLMQYMLDAISTKFANQKYHLLALVTLFFMLLGALVGSFEECVPLIPIVIALSIRLGWDKITGLGMSLLAIGCGFASGICNPFTIGVAQQLAGLPMFSGIGYRIFVFICIYVLLLLFLIGHAKKAENKTQQNFEHTFIQLPHMDKALTCFISILAIGIIVILSSTFIPILHDYTMVIVAIMFFAAGLFACILSKMGLSNLCKTFIQGTISMVPAIFMILMANSIRFTLEEAKILDTILYYFINMANLLPKWGIILFIYLIVLIMNFFISSGSAKAFLLIPIIIPIAQVFGLSSQLCILAFAFGDGFSNIFYPTNPVLLISLGLADIDYLSWIKWSWKFQFVNIALTSLLLLFGLCIGY